VRAILDRPLYRGEVVYNRTQKRDRWGVRKQSTRDESRWIRVAALRLVSEALCQAMADRARKARAAYLRSTKGAAWGRPVDGAESRYLLTGLARCGQCGCGMVVRSRHHGRQRSFRYVCGGYHLRGKMICSNSLEAPIDEADEAILSDVEAFVLNPAVLTRAIRWALDKRSPTNRHAEAERQRLTDEHHAVTGEIDNLTRALAVGGDLSSLVAALRRAEEQRQGLDRALSALDAHMALTPATAADLEAVALSKVAEWRATLRQAVPEARGVLRRLLTDRVRLDAVEEDDERHYRYAVRFTVGGLFEGIVPTLVTSPTGFEPVFWP